MSWDVLDRLDVPTGHAFLRESIMAWWFVPQKYEPQFFRLLEALWVRGVPQRLLSSGLTYFGRVIPAHDFAPFQVHFLALVQSVDETVRVDI
jgi:hypothetical protein